MLHLEVWRDKPSHSGSGTEDVHLSTRSGLGCFSRVSWKIRIIASAISRLQPGSEEYGAGGFASGAIVVGGMILDERYFGGNSTKIEYYKKGTRAFVSGSVAAGAGALATALIAAKAGGVGGAGGCSFIAPGVGTVSCGAVGAVGGFIVGLEHIGYLIRRLGYC